MDQDADGLIGLDLRDAGSPPATWQSEAAQDRYAFHLRVSLPPTLTGPCDLEQWFRLLALRDLPFPRRGPDPVNPEVLERYFRDVLRARDFGFTLPDETLTSLAQLWDRPPARPTTQFDARALGVRTLWIDGAPYDATAPFRIPLTPGRHSFRSDRSDAVAHFFTVADDGTIADDPALRGVASVVDRGTLVLLAGAGRTVTIDASRLWGPVIWIDGGAYDTRSAFFLSLAPGQHQFRTLSGPTYSFMVAADGTISNVDALPGLVDTTDPSRLVIVGRTVTIDASAVWRQGVFVAGDFIGHAGRSLNLLPGRHEFYGFGGDRYSFTVADDGTISHDYVAGHPLHGIVSAAGSRLTITGRAVTIDASALWRQEVWVAGDVTGGPAPVTLNLLPGPHQFYGVGDDRYHFTVAGDGTIASVDTPPGVVSGLGTRTLTVIGLGVTVDATALGGAPLWLGGDAFATTAPFVVHLLPGRHEFYRSPGTRYYFTVSDTGLITSIEAPEGVASGIGTSTLRLLLPQ